MGIKNLLGKATFRTFIVDPPTMLLFGIGAAWFTLKFVKKHPKKALLISCVLFQAAFWILGPMMYLDHPFFASQGLDNNFMWNGYLMGLEVVSDEWIPTYRFEVFNFIAMLGWLIQPLFLYWGVHLGNHWFKRKHP